MGTFVTLIRRTRLLVLVCTGVVIVSQLGAGISAFADEVRDTATTGQALLILKSTDINDMHETITSLKNAGIHPMHVIPPRIVIADVPADAEQSALAIYNIASLHRSAVAPFDVTGGMDLASGVAAWNRMVSPELVVPAGMLQGATPLVGDAFEPPMPAVSRLLTGSEVMQAPGSNSTSEFMIGSVAVGIILPESNGSGENWSTARQQDVFNKIVAGLNWWATKGGSAARLTFYYDQKFSVPTQYEPITRDGWSDEDTWVSDIFANMGYVSGTAIDRGRAYINNLRTDLETDTDWGYTFIVVDSLNDADGTFASGYFAWAYLGGPYVIMTYDNDNWGISNMNWVASHETGHIFLAGDEYCQPGYACCDFRYYGYLNIYNGNCESGNPSSVPCMMKSSDDAICQYTNGQIGWRDTDGDGKPDPIDNVVNNMLNYYPTPTTQTILTFTGTATDVPYDSPTRTDVTINKISTVKYRIDGGAWVNASASDGSFNQDSEGYTFTTPSLGCGVYLIETQAFSTSGNSSVIRFQNVEIQVPPVAGFVGSPTSGYCFLDMNFTDQSIGQINTWNWTFGDGGTSTLRNPSHKYQSQGVFTVSLTVTCCCGSDIETKPNYIIVTTPLVPVAEFVGVPTSGYCPLPANFTDLSTDSVTGWSWSFGDGGTSTAQNPSHTYNAGLFTVSLTVTNCSGSDTETKTDYITVTPPAPPVAGFVGSPTSGYRPLTVNFTDQSQPTGQINKWNWDFGDNRDTTSTAQNPSHTYKSAGLFTVSLTVTNCGGDGNEVKTDYITVTRLPPILISDAEQLNGIGKDRFLWDRYFKLVADIDMSYYGGGLFNIIGDDAVHFTGGFDGNGYRISNFAYTSLHSGEYVGLFGYIGDDGEVNDVYMTGVNINVENRDYVGGLAGYSSGTIKDCYVATVAENSISGGDFVGGLVGVNEGTITKSHTAANISGTDYVGGLTGFNDGSITGSHVAGYVEGWSYVGGLVGDSFMGEIGRSSSTATVRGDCYIGGFIGLNDSGTITDCYARGPVFANSNVGGLAGMNHNGGRITNCYSVGSVAMATSNKGGLVGYDYQAYYTKCFWDVNVNPDLNGIGNRSDPNVTGKKTAEMKDPNTFVNWNFTNVWMINEGVDYPVLIGQKYGGGAGTAENPYLIYTPEDMNTIGSDSNDWDKCFRLMADIDLSRYTGTKFKTIGNGDKPFNGIFYGHQLTISNFTCVSSSVNYAGLFGVIGAKGRVEGLVLDNVNVSAGAGYYAGGLAGVNYGTISGCLTKGTISGTNYVGGLAGYNYQGIIEDCYSTAAVSGNSIVGGLVGYDNRGVTTNCYSIGTVSGSSYTGGLIGKKFMGTFQNSFWDTQTSGQSTSAGGTGKITVQMKMKSTFTGWDFTGIWKINEGIDYPRFIWEGLLGPTSSANFYDFAVLAGRWTQTGCNESNGYCQGADLDRSGAVDTQDLMMLSENWLK